MTQFLSQLRELCQTQVETGHPAFLAQQGQLLTPRVGPGGPSHPAPSDALRIQDGTAARRQGEKGSGEFGRPGCWAPGGTWVMLVIQTLIHLSSSRLSFFHLVAFYFLNRSYFLSEVE